MSTLLFVLSYILTFIAGAFAWVFLTSVAVAHLARKGKAALPFTQARMRNGMFAVDTCGSDRKFTSTSKQWTEKWNTNCLSDEKQPAFMAGFLLPVICYNYALLSKRRNDYGTQS